jgi:hypothetical protein
MLSRSSFIQILKNFPKFIWVFVQTVIYDTLTSIDPFLLFVFAVLVGFAFTAIIGATVYVGGYIFIRLFTTAVAMLTSRSHPSHNL